MNSQNGIPFHAVDMHIHTPASTCYSEKSNTPESIVETALARRLKAIAVSDHNTVQSVDAIRRAAGTRGLTVFPGIELSTNAGHFLGIFAEDAKTKDLDSFLVSIGIAPEQRGDGGITIGIAAEELFKRIQQAGGLTIAAHIERWPSGFLESKLSRQAKAAIHSSEFLNALEITIPQNKTLWNKGQMRGYPKKHACVQGSDAHALKEIGRRPTYFKIKEINLESLRQALVDYESSISFTNGSVPE